ncbi:ester cyclase [Stigmatella sp. ncwal1]|uniref:Ester cyclase n=1 Tax=Stigmatella ashevillensis TaxID=2995309 RepID=A0ABT5D814_9BACT|nr:ester cyclase [Stigmatella ashevillena]MDC0709808.1 ester cyclase [Stigmatella ashevillena]
MTTRPILTAFAFLTLLSTPPALAEDTLPQPKKLTISQGLTPAQAQPLLQAARRYYAFWNTGDEAYAQAALAPDFVDLNLPESRPQGPTGPLVASRTFRKAVPDLQVSVEEVWVAGNQVVGRLRFTGHFTGLFGDLQGKGQSIQFDAVDIYTVKDGRIAANWHLEDNLALLKQLGVVKP